MRPQTAILVLGLVLGCISTNRATLDETAALFHDDLRWGRIPAAEGAVDARARAAFQQRHRGWGAAVRIMDMDLEGVRIGENQGVVRLRLTWTVADGTDVRESVIEENWESVGGNWRLREERVIGGDPAIFGAPPGPAPPEGPTAR